MFACCEHTIHSKNNNNLEKRAKKKTNPHMQFHSVRLTTLFGSDLECMKIPYLCVAYAFECLVQTLNFTMDAYSGLYYIASLFVLEILFFLFIFLCSTHVHTYTHTHLLYPGSMSDKTHF